MAEQDEFIPGYHTDENEDLINEIGREILRMPDGRGGRVEVWSEGGCVFVTFFLDATGIEGIAEKELAAYLAPSARKRGVQENNLAGTGSKIIESENGGKEWSVTFFVKDGEDDEW